VRALKLEIRNWEEQYKSMNPKNAHRANKFYFLRFHQISNFYFPISTFRERLLLFYPEKPGPQGQVRVIRLCLEKCCKSLK